MLRLYFKILKSVHSNEALYNSMYADGNTLNSYNAGSWMSASGWGINVKAAMTYEAKASLLVEVKFTTILTNEQSSVFG